MLNIPKFDHIILMVEDDKSTKELVKAVVQRENRWKIVSVDDAPNAIDAWDHSDFDLILMDLHLPMMGGIEATSKIRRLEKISGRRHTPIIAFTATVDDASKQRCVEAGFDDFLAKPVKIAEIVEKIRKHLLH